MKEEKEVHYLKLIYLSDFVSGFLKTPRSGTKSDFEIVCGISEKNKEFRSWLNDLIKEGVLKESGYAENKKPLHVASANAILKKLNSIPYYKKYKKVEYDDYEGVFRY